MTNIETWRYQYADNYQGARKLLANEAQGFAIDATQYDEGEAVALYVGGPVGGTVTVKSASDAADVLISKSLDASNLVQSGTSPKMVLWSSAPYLMWTPHNIGLGSQTHGTSNPWSPTGAGITVTNNVTTAPDGTSTAASLVYTNNNDDWNRATNAVTVESGVVYTVSIYAKPFASGWLYLNLVNASNAANGVQTWFNVSSGTVGTTSTRGTGWSSASASTITSVGSGWYRCTITVLTGAATAFIMFGGANGDNTAAVTGNSIYTWGSQLVRGYNANPYLVTTTTARYGIPQEYDTAASKFGILVEPASTNSVTYSEQFNNAAWTKAAAITVTADNTTAPNGATTADKIECNTGGGSRYIQQTGLAGGTATRSASCFFKAGNINWVYMEITDAIDDSAGKFFNINTGSVGSTVTAGTYTIASSSITSVGNGWYRCQITVACNTTVGVNILMADADNDTTIATNDYIYAWGAQFEGSSVATSYIPTVGSTVTRAVDNITAPTSGFSLGGSYSEYHQSKLLGHGASGALFCSIDDGTTTHSAYQFRFNSASALRFDVKAGASCALGGLGDITLGTAFKAGWRAETNNFNQAKDGTADTADTSGVMPTNPTVIRLANFSGVDANYTAPVRLFYLVHLPRALSNTELQTVTT